MSDSHADVSSDEEGLDSGNFSDNWYTDDDKDEEERYEYGEENGLVVETVTRLSFDHTTEWNRLPGDSGDHHSCGHLSQQDGGG